MLTLSILYLLLSNVVTLWQNKSILFSRLTTIILLYCCFLALASLYIASLHQEIGLSRASFFEEFWFLIALFFGFLIYMFIFIHYKYCLAYNSLEWCLNSPPKPHAFVSSFLQSKFKFKFNFNLKQAVKKFIFASFIILVTAMCFKWLIWHYWGIDVFKQYLHFVSISYYTFMVFYCRIVKGVIDRLIP